MQSIGRIEVGGTHVQLTSIYTSDYNSWMHATLKIYFIGIYNMQHTTCKDYRLHGFGFFIFLSGFTMLLFYAKILIGSMNNSIIIVKCFNK